MTFIEPALLDIPIAGLCAVWLGGLSLLGYLISCWNELADWQGGGLSLLGYLISCRNELAEYWHSLPVFLPWNVWEGEGRSMVVTSHVPLTCIIRASGQAPTALK